MTERDLPGVLTLMRRAGRTGRTLSSFPPRVIAAHAGVHSLTLTLVSTDGALELVWADPRDPVGPPMEDLQYTLGEGPTPDAARTRALVTTADLSTDASWPALASAAPATSPARSAAALPLHLGVIVPGVLTAYRTAPAHFTHHQIDILAALAAALIHPLLQTATAQAPNGMPDLLRAEVHQAAGMTSVQLDIPIDQALLRVRAHAWTHNRPLREVAHRIVTGRLHLSPG